MVFESFNAPPPQEEKPDEVVLEQPKTPEVKKDEPETLEKWVEDKLSDLMMRRMAGENVDLVKDLPQAPENLVKESVERTGSEGEKIADDYIRLMRDALDHPSPDNFYSVWLESQGEEAKRTLRTILENPDRIKSAIKEHVEKSEIETAEKLKSEEVFRSPFERVADKLKEAKQNLEQEGLSEDASHVDEIIGKLEKISTGDFNLTVELWNGESNPPEKTGWYPSDRAKEIILEAIGTSYKRGNFQSDDLSINYYSDQFHTDRVKLEVRENLILDKPGVFSKASVIFPSKWYQERNQ